LNLEYEATNVGGFVGKKNAGFDLLFAVFDTGWIDFWTHACL
jgi:hypothetical protein